MNKDQFKKNEVCRVIWNIKDLVIIKKVNRKTVNCVYYKNRNYPIFFTKVEDLIKLMECPEYFNEIA